MILKLYPAKTVEEVEVVLKDPEIFDRISADGQTLENFEIEFNDHNMYLMIDVDGECIGTFNLHSHNINTMMVHISILKNHRKHGNMAGQLFYEWIIRECDQKFHKFITEVPVIYHRVYEYTKRFGFKDEGINRASLKKNGRYIDQRMVGITRDEIKHWLDSNELDIDEVAVLNK